MSWGDKMNIDLKPLYNRSKEDINISGTYTIPKDYFASNKDVIAINDILVDGYIYLDEEDMLWAKLNITGKIDLKDSISLEDVKYPIKIEFDDMIEENYKKDENTLDIFAFLWENILLDVPLQYTEVKDLSKFQGKDWKLVSEDDIDEE